MLTSYALAAVQLWHISLKNRVKYMRSKINRTCVQFDSVPVIYMSSTTFCKIYNSFLLGLHGGLEHDLFVPSRKLAKLECFLQERTVIDLIAG